MLKKILIGTVASAAIYVLVSGDYSFSGPRYRVMAYAYMLADHHFDAAQAETDVADTPIAGAKDDPGKMSTPSRGYVHLGSLRSTASAEQEWVRLQERFGAHLADLDHVVERIDLGTKGVYYRVLADTNGSGFSPQQLCSVLRRSNQYCDLVAPGPEGSQPESG